MGTYGLKLDRLVRAEDYLASNRAQLFKSKLSLSWFIRQHRDELLRSKALLIRGRSPMLIDPQAFDEVVGRVYFDLSTEHGAVTGTEETGNAEPTVQ